MPRGSPLPPYLAGLPRWARPGTETPLFLWLRGQGLSVSAFAKAIGVDPKAAGYWINGRALPSLVNAFKVEKYTNGQVPVSSWLGTELGIATWRAERHEVNRGTP
jgi:transcriptional regulator with XRE-family HTH domain